jgi:hypothetical protein
MFPNRLPVCRRRRLAWLLRDHPLLDQELPEPVLVPVRRGENDRPVFEKYDALLVPVFDDHRAGHPDAGPVVQDLRHGNRPQGPALRFLDPELVGLVAEFRNHLGIGRKRKILVQDRGERRSFGRPAPLSQHHHRCHRAERRIGQPGCQIALERTVSRVDTEDR